MKRAFSVGAAVACSMLCLAGGSGCGGAQPGAAQGLVVDVALGPSSSNRSDVAMARVSLFIARLRAVSDRGLDDPRATLAGVALDPSATVKTPLAAAPPGLYSAVIVDLGDADHSGVEMSGSYNGNPLEILLDAGSLVVPCMAPARLAEGGLVTIGLTATPAGWLDGVALDKATSDGDERGLDINDEDNAALAPAIIARLSSSFVLACN